MKRARLLPALLLAAAGPAGAASASSLNPDRWNTVEISQGGSSSMKGDQTTYNFAAPGDRNSKLRTLNVSAAGLALLPVSDAYTLSVGAGGLWNETDTAGGANASNDDQATYQFGVRRYFEGAYSSTWQGSANPDRWASLGLACSGARTLNHSAGNATGNFDQDLQAFNSTLAADLRVPVDPAWTVLAGLSGIDGYSKLEPTAANNGSKTVTETIAANAGVRRYLVGKNLIMEDAGVNPDKWIMISLNLGGGVAVHSRQSLTTQAGPDAGRRAIDSRFYTATLATRVPITDHMSLSFSLSGTYNRTYTPVLPVAAGNLNRVTPINFTASLRYFLF